MNPYKRPEVLFTSSDLRMASFPAFVFAVLLARCAQAAVVQPRNGAEVQADQEADLYKVPKGLLIGAGLSATQAEGAWREGKAISVMDKVAITDTDAFKVSNEVAADHYTKYREDLAMAKELKFTSHRFSISWSRVFPTANISDRNEKGITFYHDYIDEVIRNGMEPMVTMYHFDHPWTLEEKTGGWTSDEMITKFVEYAGALFEEYGNKVKYWNPINEGNMYCIYVPPALGLANLEPYDPNTFYKCLHNTILAHAKTYRLYKKKYYDSQKGMVGTSLLMWPATALTLDYQDEVAAEIFNQVFAGTSISPMVFGDYPALTRYLVDKRSFGELNLTESRLPTFSEEDRKTLIEGGPCTDFIALNVYSAFTVRYGVSNASDHGGLAIAQILQPVLSDMLNVQMISTGSLDTDNADVMKTSLLWTWNNYHLPIVITENGYADMKGDGVNDYASRAAYHSANLRGLVRTMNEYHVPVISYHAWALIDVWEFTAGYAGRPFGLIHVDYANGTLKRTLKASSKFFIELGETGRVPEVDPITPSGSGSTITTTVFPPLLLSLLAIVGLRYA